MRIKKNIKAETDIVVTQQESIVPEDCKYSIAIDNIMHAIESLAEVAQDDEVAKDSIANLSVVILDLKGSCEGTVN